MNSDTQSIIRKLLKNRNNQVHANQQPASLHTRLQSPINRNAQIAPTTRHLTLKNRVFSPAEQRKPIITSKNQVQEGIRGSD